MSNITKVRNPKKAVKLTNAQKRAKKARRKEVKRRRKQAHGLRKA